MGRYHVCRVAHWLWVVLLLPQFLEILLTSCYPGVKSAIASSDQDLRVRCPVLYFYLWLLLPSC
jgi:hypothetical protein